jgi:hypothetical protein
VTADLWAIAVAILSAAFSAGATYAALQARMRKNAADIRGVADSMRANARVEERRWKLMIASQVEQLEPHDRAARIARWLSDDAGR